MGANSRVDLLIPGLFGPIPVLPGDLPHFPSLSRMLGKADRLPSAGADPASVLFERFELEVQGDRDLPSAPFSYLADVAGAPPDGYRLHADPIHLRPDRDRLLLFDARHLQLEREETDSLVELFNGHFAAAGMRLEAPATERWYLHAQEPPRIRTSPLEEVVGRGIERSYLRGEDAAHWMRWLNEAQMLFHHSPVNQRRELAGRPGVSGIWPWGGGSLPAKMPQSRYGAVFAGASLAVGLAKAARIEAYPLPVNARDILAAPRSRPALAFWDTLWPAVLDGDGAAWVRDLSRLVRWIDELAACVKTGEVGELLLYPCDGTCLKVTPRALRRFWRRPVGIAAFLPGMPTG